MNSDSVIFHEDNDLWAEGTKTVTPANRDDVLIKKETKPAKKKTAGKQGKVQATKSASPSLQKPQTKPFVNPADLRSKTPAMRAGIDNASAKRLTKGSFSIDDRLDLHGRSEAQAHKALMQFVQQANCVMGQEPCWSLLVKGQWVRAFCAAKYQNG